jgi:hypothetical protein
MAFAAPDDLGSFALHVQQGQVIAAAVTIELADRRTDLMVWFVDQHRGLEPGNPRVPQGSGERLRVACWRRQLPQRGVLVLVGGDQQRQPPAHPLPRRPA